MMQIPKKVFDKWEANKTKGDFNRIAKLAGVSSNTVRRAYKSKVCCPEVIEAVIELYESREELLREYMD